MNNEIYQKILNILETILPEKWANIMFIADYDEESYEMKYYADFGDGDFKDCFELAVVSKTEFAKAFIAINKVLSAERNKLEGKHKWKKITLNMSNDYKFKAEFGY